MKWEHQNKATWYCIIMVDALVENDHDDTANSDGVKQKDRAICELSTLINSTVFFPSQRYARVNETSER